MKNDLRGKLSVIFIFLIVLMFFSFFPAFTRLEKITTSHFIIYYEKHLDNYLDNEYIKFMEESYNFLSNLFNLDFKNKIYVYFSSREKVANGFNVPIGQPTIYIITTPPELDSTIGNMDEWFKLVFYHELTHQFSLSLKNGFSTFLSYLFGNLFLFTYINNPFYMMEGVTTSLEGRDQELGRTNSPAIKEFIMQSIIDNNFKNPYELEESYSEYPYNSLGYWYGGFFSKFLQENYGMDLYIKLWQTTICFPFEIAIKDVYKKDLMELWEEFYNWIKPNFEVAVNYNSCIKELKKDIIINGRLAKIKDKTYYFYYNSTVKSIFKYDIETKKNEVVLKNILTFYSFEIDENKNLLLLQYIDNNKSNYLIKNKIYNIESRKYEKSVLDKFDSIREITFFNDDFIGIDLSRSFTDLVLIKKDGTKETLIYGNKKLYVSMPKTLNSKTIVFLGSQNGIRNLYSFDIETKELKKMDTNTKFIYHFNVYQEKIYFVFNDDFTLSKFGFLDDNFEIHLDKNFSGGFNDPFYIDDKIFYIGKFSNKSLLLSLDLSLNSIVEQIKNKSEKLTSNDNLLNSIKVFERNKTKDQNKNDGEEIKDNNYQDKEDNKSENKNERKEENKNESKQENQSNNEDYDEYIVVNKLYIIYPFNENLLPDYWLPSISLYYFESSDSSSLYYNGFGLSFFWLDFVSNSVTNLGLYIVSYEPFRISVDFYSNLNYFYPFSITLFFASYWGGDVFVPNSEIKYLFVSGIDLTYSHSDIVGVRGDFINIGAFYRNINEKFISFYLYYYNISYLFNSNNLPLIFKNYLYLSNIDFQNYYYVKYEFETSLFIKSLNIEFKDNLAISKDKNLNYFPINKYYHNSLYDPMHELNFEYPDLNFNFINIVTIEATIFKTNQLGILNIILNPSSSVLGFYLGTKYYFVSDINFNNFQFENSISLQIIYGSIIIEIVNKLITLGLFASYCVESNKKYYYFYYIIGNPYVSIFGKK